MRDIGRLELLVVDLVPIDVLKETVVFDLVDPVTSRTKAFFRLEKRG